MTCQVNEGNYFGLVENADQAVTGQHKPSNVGDLITNPQGGRSIKFRWWTKELVTLE